MFTRGICSHPKDIMSSSPPRSKSFKFHPLPQDSPSSRPLTPSDGGSSQHHSLGSQQPEWLFPTRRPPYILVLTTLLFFVLVILLSFYIGRTWDSQFATETGPISLEDITRYSPILDDIPLTYTLKQFNGSLLKPNIYRGDASPSVDAAWEALGANYRALTIPSQLASKSGLLPSHVHISPKYGGGYPANIEGLHHLHCLNLLRQALYYNYEYYKSRGEGAFKNAAYVVKMHVSHCLDILRQQLMCQVDVGVMGQVWWNREEPQTYVNFNTGHMCRDFEGIRAWAEERQLPLVETLPEDWLEPPREGDVFEEMP